MLYYDGGRKPESKSVGTVRKGGAMAEQVDQVLYHKCGAAVVQDADGTFRAIDARAEGSILVCPVCGAVLRERHLYNDRSDIARDMLYDVGWYPDPDSLALLEDPAQRAAILSAIEAAVEDMGDADLLAVFTVVSALTGG
jgi:hypothetical protein